MKNGFLKTNLYVCVLLLFPLLLIGQEETIATDVTVLLQDKTKFSGELEAEYMKSMVLKINEENYVLKKRDIIAVIPSSILAENLENDILEKDFIVLKNKVLLACDILKIDDKTVYVEIGNKTQFLRLNSVKNIFPKGQSASILLSTMDSKNYTVPSVLSKLSRQFGKRGFYHIAYGNISNSGEDDLGILGGLGVEYVFGYQISQTIGFGLGLGCINYNNLNKDFIFDGVDASLISIIPVFGEIRGYLSDNKTSVYYNLAVGIANGGRHPSEAYNLTTPRMFTHPAIGYKIGSDKSALLIDLGMQFSNVEYSGNVFSLTPIDKIAFERVVLRLGFML